MHCALGARLIRRRRADGSLGAGVCNIHWTCCRSPSPCTHAVVTSYKEPVLKLNREGARGPLCLKIQTKFWREIPEFLNHHHNASHKESHNINVELTVFQLYLQRPRSPTLCRAGTCRSRSSPAATSPRPSCRPLSSRPASYSCNLRNWHCAKFGNCLCLTGKYNTL